MQPERPNLFPKDHGRTQKLGEAVRSLARQQDSVRCAYLAFTTN